MVELIIDASNSTSTKKSHMAGFPIGGHICAPTDVVLKQIDL